MFLGALDRPGENKRGQGKLELVCRDLFDGLEEWARGVREIVKGGYSLGDLVCKSQAILPLKIFSASVVSQEKNPGM
jgi:hypothetical protein